LSKLILDRQLMYATSIRIGDQADIFIVRKFHIYGSFNCFSLSEAKPINSVKKK